MLNKNDNLVSHKTYWQRDGSLPSFQKLNRSMTADVLIVGAGVTGLTAAYLLSKQGRAVTVIDAGQPGNGETCRTTAHLTEVIDSGYAEIESFHGEKNARLAFDSQRAAIRFIEHTIGALKIECQFKRLDGYLFLHPTDQKESLEKELETLRRMGLSEAEFCSKVPLPGREAGVGLRFPNQAQFHPLQYLSALVKQIDQAGGQFFTGTHVAKIDSHKVLTSDGFEITANEIIIATHSPIKNILFFLKEAAYRTYVIAAEVPKGSVPEALYWDTGDQSIKHSPYHYVRMTPKSETVDLLIVGGEDHKTGQEDDGDLRFKNLEQWARKYFPMMGEVEYQWSGQVVEPVDGLPYIGKSPYHKDIYIATGYSGNGMTNGTLAGLILTDLIMGIKNQWAELFSPTRKNLRSGMNFLEENLNVVKELIFDRIKKEPLSAEDLARGEGAIIQKGLHKMAVYRDEKGTLSECSATCPHLGGVVQWNSTEKTFDCPLHGSRFTADGIVITGPAIRDLKKELCLLNENKIEANHV